MRKPILFSLVVAAVAATAFFGVATSACACIGPMSDNELRTLIQKADKGDIRATGRVWQEYALVREDAPRGKIWASRAIRAGDPWTMSFMADRWMWEGQRAIEKRHKLVFYDAAVRLLENGYRNRDMLAICDASGFNNRYFYVADLRRARAALATARSGPEVWIQRVNKDGASAAYHVANHYFWVELDQKKRGQWEQRASELGDPMFAGNGARQQSASDDVRDIALALNTKSEIAKLGDAWVQGAVTANLRERLAMKRHFASGRTGKFNGESCRAS